MTNQSDFKDALTKLAHQKMGAHFEEEVLVDYVDHLLDEEETLRVQEHLAACAACAQMALMLTEPPEVAVFPEPAQPSKTAWRGLALAASLFLVMFIGVWKLAPGNDPVIRSDVALTDLFPIGVSTDRDPKAKTLPEIARGRPSLLLFNTLKSPTHERWVVRFLVDGTLVQQHHAEPTNPLLLLVTPDWREGTCEVTLSGEIAGEEVVLETYVLRVVL